jgi:hypothetical protein
VKNSPSVKSTKLRFQCSNKVVLQRFKRISKKAATNYHLTNPKNLRMSTDIVVSLQPLHSKNQTKSLHRTNNSNFIWPKWTRVWATEPRRKNSERVCKRNHTTRQLKICTFTRQKTAQLWMKSEKKTKSYSKPWQSKVSTWDKKAAFV